MSAGEPLGAGLNYAQCWEDVRLLEEARLPPNVFVIVVYLSDEHQDWRAAREHLRVVGFEPDPVEYARLKAAAEALETRFHSRHLLRTHRASTAATPVNRLNAK